MGGLSENKLQKARKFNTDHIIFLNIPKFEITSRIVPKKENFSEKELNEIQTSLETLSTNISTSLKKIQTEIEHILEIQATEDDSNIVQGKTGLSLLQYTIYNSNSFYSTSLFSIN